VARQFPKERAAREDAQRSYPRSPVFFRPPDSLTLTANRRWILAPAAALESLTETLKNSVDSPSGSFQAPRARSPLTLVLAPPPPLPLPRLPCVTLHPRSLSLPLTLGGDGDDACVDGCSGSNGAAVDASPSTYATSSALPPRLLAVPTERPQRRG
jgi:hypothetical protein